MKRDCSYFRDEIPKGVLSDLSEADQKGLKEHLAECGGCAREHDLYTGTLRQLKCVGDEEVPRHFFVYQSEQKSSPWSLFRLMSPAWQGAVLSFLLLLGTLSALATSRLHVRAGDGALTVAFGRLPEQNPPQPQVPTVDPSKLEARILEVVEERSRKENLEWVKAMRSEIAQSQKGLTQKQRVALETALASLEGRMVKHVETTARRLEERNDLSVANLYQTISRQRERDQSAFDAKLARLVMSGEIKNKQTDAILETLLQVAELRLK